MISIRLGTGLRTGLLAAATTAGVVVGLGLRHDSALTPFLVSGRSVIAATSGLVASPVVATVFGVVVHTVWMILWGLCFSVVATPLRGMALTIGALFFAALVGFLTATVVPGALGAGSIAASTLPQTIFLLALFALSLAAGMRIARTSS